MNDKEIGEIRRHLRRDRSSITKIYGCFVNDNKEIITEFSQSTGIMPENEGDKYFALFKRVLSGSVGKNLIDLERIIGNGRKLFLRGKAHGVNVIIVDHRVAQVIVFVAVFKHGALEARAFRKAQALCKRAGGHVAHNHLNGHDFHMLDKRLPLGKFLYEMRRNAVLLQKLHHAVGHAVVDCALAGDGAFFQAVERGCVVLVVHDEKVLIVRFEHLFGFAFINLFELFHCSLLR